MQSAQEAQSNRIRILVADDHPIVRSGLLHLLSAEPDLEVVCTAADGQQAIVQTLGLRPDVVLMDLEMPALSGIEATRLITSQFPTVRIICLSMHEEADYSDLVLKAGAIAYLCKNAEPTKLLATIRSCVGRPDSTRDHARSAGRTK